MRTRNVVVVGIVGVLVFGAMRCWRVDHDVVVESSELVRGHGPLPEPSSRETHALLVPRRALVAVATLVVKDSVSGAPLHGVSVYPDSGKTTRTLNVSGQASVAKTANDGICSLPTDFDTQCAVICFLQGYRPLRLRLRGLVQHEVVMQRGHRSIIAVCNQDGQPVQSCRVIVSRGPAIAALYTDNGIGDPDSPQSLWSAVSDADGLVALDDLPEGEFHVTAAHPSHYQVEAPHLLVPGAGTRIMMAPLWGAAFVSAPGERVVAYRVRTEGLSQEGNSLASAASRRMLAQRFPDAVPGRRQPIALLRTSWRRWRVASSLGRLPA
jgi:hypothetical protein